MLNTATGALALRRPPPSGLRAGGALATWPLRLTWICAAAAIVSYALVLALLPDEHPALILLDDLGSTLAAGVAAILCMLAARRHATRRGRLSWLLLGLGLACWAYGDGYWAWSEIVLGETPDVPSWADLGYIATVVLVIAGTATTPITRAREISRARLLLDTAIIMTSTVAIAWSVVLGPLFTRLQTDPLTQAVTLLYPLGSIGSLFLLAILMIRSAETPLSTRLLAVGWALIGTADVAYLVLAAGDTYSTGSLTDLFWFAGAVPIGLAAAHDRPTPAPELPPHNIGQRWQFVMPVVLIVLTRIVIWLHEPGTLEHVPRPEQAMLLVAAALLIARIALGYRDTVLVHELFVQRTRELEATQQAVEEAARLQGVIMTGRELGHLLSNDLALAVGWIDLMREHPDLPPDLHDVVVDAADGLDRAVEHLQRLQQVNRVTTRETPVGLALDLERSVGQPNDSGAPSTPV